MNNLNRVTLIGRLGKDPEVRYTPSGHAVCNFSLATEHRTKKGSEWIGETTWHQIVAWRQLAELAGESLSKGDLVYIDGRINQESWQDRDSGKTVYATKIVANTIMRCEILAKREREDFSGTSDHGLSDDPDDDTPF